MDSHDRGAVGSAMRTVVLVLLAVDGILCATAAALLLPLHIGVVAFPISGVVAGLVNMTLVWAAMFWTSSNRLAALPIWTWLGTIAILTFGGPGGDVIFSALGPVLVVLVLGVAPPTWLLWRRTQGNQLPPSARLLLDRNRIRQARS